MQLLNGPFGEMVLFSTLKASLITLLRKQIALKFAEGNHVPRRMYPIHSISDPLTFSAATSLTQILRLYSVLHTFSLYIEGTHQNRVIA